MGISIHSSLNSHYISKEVMHQSHKNNLLGFFLFKNVAFEPNLHLKVVLSMHIDKSEKLHPSHNFFCSKVEYEIRRAYKRVSKTFYACILKWKYSLQKSLDICIG